MYYKNKTNFELKKNYVGKINGGLKAFPVSPGLDISQNSV